MTEKTEKTEIDKTISDLVTSKAELESLLTELRALLAENKLKSDTIFTSIDKIEKKLSHSIIIMLSFLIMIALINLFGIFSSYSAINHVKWEQDCLVKALLLNDTAEYKKCLGQKYQ
jgi:hypothetical protein